MRNDPYNPKTFRNTGTGDRDGNNYSNYRHVNPRQGSTSQSLDAYSPTNRNYNRPSGYNQNSQEYYNSSNRPKLAGNTSLSNNHFYNQSPISPSANTRISPTGSREHKLSNKRDQPLPGPGRQQFRTLPHQDVTKSQTPQTTPHNPVQRASYGKDELRFSPPPDAAVRQLSTHRVPSYAKPSNQRQQQSSVGSYFTPTVPPSPPYFNNGQPPLPPMPQTPPPPPPNEAPPPEVDPIRKQYVGGRNLGNKNITTLGDAQKLWRYNETIPYNAALMSATYRHPPPPIIPQHYYLPNSDIGMLPPPSNLYPQPQPYLQPRSYINNQSLRLNSYKRKPVDSDMDMRKNNKKRKKPLSQNIPQRKDWSVEEAQRALEVEQECNKRARRQSLIIKFPDLDLNRDIVSKFHSAIENVHFQQPSTARFCFVTLRGSADPETVIKELNRTKFGQGYLAAEVKKDREDDLAIGPEDIDPMTLYVGNLAQDVTKEAMMRTFPNNKRIDIGYAKKMKYTRYAFVSFSTVDLAIEAFKKTHNTQMHSKSLIVRFRRLHGTVGMPGEPKTPLPNRSDTSIRPTTTSECETDRQNGPWDTVDVSGWLPDTSVKTEPSDCTDDEYDLYDYQEKMDDQYYESENRNMSYDYDNSSEDIKPQLPILKQRAQDDCVPQSRTSTEDVINRDLTRAESTLSNKDKTGKEQSENSISNIDENAQVNRMLVPKPFVEVIKRDNSEMALEEVHSSGKTDSDVIKPKVTSSISVKNYDRVSGSRQLTASDEPNMAYHKPLVELVKQEAKEKQSDNKDRKTSDSNALRSNMKELVPKPIIEEKPKIDTDPSGCCSSSKEESFTGTQNVRTRDLIPKPIVEEKPTIDFETGHIKSSSLSDKDGPKTDLEQISNTVSTLCTAVPRPLILLPEVKREATVQDQNDHDRFNSGVPLPITIPKSESTIQERNDRVRSTNGVPLPITIPKLEGTIQDQNDRVRANSDVPLPIILPKVERNSSESKRNISNNPVKSNPKDLVPKPKVEIKKENVDGIEGHSKAVPETTDLMPKRRIEDLVPRPLIEVKKQNQDNDVHPETSSTNIAADVPKPLSDIKEEKPNINYEMQLTHELIIDDKKILHESEEPSTQ